MSTEAWSETRVPTKERVPSWAIDSSVSCWDGLVLGLLEKSAVSEGCDNAKSEPELPSSGLLLAGLQLADGSSSIGGRVIAFLEKYK